MKKKIVMVMVMVFVVLLLSLSMVSAFSLCDLFPFFCKDKSITGMAGDCPGNETCPDECGDGVVSSGETEYTCCEDVGCESLSETNYSLWMCEKGISNVYDYVTRLKTVTGKNCNTATHSCDLDFSDTTWDSDSRRDCASGELCANGVCVLLESNDLTCSGQEGIICTSAQTCVGTSVDSSDSDRCCIGTCGSLENSLTCSQQGKNICTAGQECSGYFVNSSDSNLCCNGVCGVANETSSTCTTDCDTTTTSQSTTTTSADQTTSDSTPTTSTTKQTPTTPSDEPAYEPTQVEVTETIVLKNGTASCSQGCLYENACFPIGIRKKINGVNSYCNTGLSEGENVVYVWDSQREEDFVCENHYECRSNFCIEDKCVKSGLITKIINWFKKLFSIVSLSEGNEGTNQTTPESNQTATNQTS